MIDAQFTREELIAKFYKIYFYRKHLDVAARDILGLNLAPHHRLIIRAWGKQRHYNMVLASRGMGKSILIAIYFVLVSILYPKNKLMIIGGAGFRQSKMVMLEAEKVVKIFLQGQQNLGYARASLEDSRRVINKDPSFWSMSWANGSLIYSVPLGDGTTIRGLRALIIAQDEAFMLPAKMVQQILDPMLAVLHDPTKGVDEQILKTQIIETSTIDYTFRNFYSKFERFKLILKDDKEVAVDNKKVSKDEITLFEFNFEDSFYPMRNGKRKTLWGMDINTIYEEKQDPNKDLAIWNAEHKNIALDISGGYFPFDAIERCYNVDLSGKMLDLFPEVLDSCSGKCVLGIDTAPSSANSAFVVIKIGTYDSVTKDVSLCETANMGQPCPFLGTKNICNYKNFISVIYAYEQNKMSQKDRVKLIYDLMERYNIIFVALDARGGGFELSSLLKDGDYIRNMIGSSLPPIYDPDVDESLNAVPMLKLYSTSQSDNLLFNGFMKGLITNTRLLFPRPIKTMSDNPRIYESYGHIETLINQLIRIRAIESGKSIRFDIEATNPDTGKVQPGKKDIYSALLYAVAKTRELIEEKNNTYEETYELALPIALNI